VVADSHNHAKINSLNPENDLWFCFSKIIEAFTVKQKMISVDHYFRSHQTPKNAENIYAETNGA
jgi:hypothetical protein